MRSIKTLLAIVLITAFFTAPAVAAQEEDWFDKGLKLLGQQRYDDAIKAFSTAIEIIPRDYQAYNYRGVAWALKENFDQAVADYSKAIKIRPRYAEAHNNRGFAQTQKGNLREALKDYTRALEINPFFVDAYNNKAWVLATCADRRIRDGGQAVRLALKAMELKPDVGSMDTLAAAYAAVGNFESAIDIQKKAIQKLMLANKNSEVPKYLAHLNSYKSQQSLVIDYAAGPQTAAAQNEEILLKAPTQEKPLPAASPAKAEAETKTQKTLAAVKAPKPTATPTAKKTAATPAKPSPPAKKQKAAAAVKYPTPTIAPAAGKTAAAPVKPLPYTIQVSAFQDPQRSNQVARKLSTNGDPAFTSPVDLSGKGKWYRVYIGNYMTLEEARTAADDLKRRRFRYVNVSKKPYTVQVGAPISRADAQKVKSRLQAKGYFSYSLPAANHPNRIRILVGAYESQEAATGLVQQLQKDGFAPKVGLK